MIGNKPYECTCGSRKFIQLVQVINYALGGSGTSAAGYKCADCGSEVTGGSLSRMDEIRKIKEQRTLMEARLRELEGHGDGTTEKAGLAQGKATETQAGRSV